MVIAMLFAAALPPAGAASTLPTCSLVTPRGDAIGFVIWGAGNPDEIRLSSTSGSAWPARTVIGTRQRGSSDLRFAIGGSDGFLLELNSSSQGQQRAATLIRRDGQNGPLPMAYGFCEERQAADNADEPGPDRNAVGADNPAFDPARWPDDCGLILSDGRRVRLAYTLVGTDQARFASADLWSGHPVTATIRWTYASNNQVGSFSRRGGPEGVQVMFVRGSQAVKLVRLRQVGEPSAPNLTAYGICGYKQIVRRAS